MSFGGKAGPPPLATRENAAVVRPKVRTTVAKDACDDSVGAFIMNVSKKIHDEWQNPSLAWKKIVPMLVFTYERYDKGHAPQHIIEHICRSLNNLVRGNGSNTKELRECLADNGGIEVLVDVLRRSTNGGVPTRTRYCAAQVPATDVEAGGQYSVFTHSLVCGVLEKKLDLLGFGKYVSRKYAACMKGEGKVQAPFVTCSMAGDFYFHKRFNRSGAPVTEKTIEDDEFEFRLQRYSGMNVINIDNFSTNAPSNKRIVIRPPAPSGANFVEANKHISPNLARRIPTERKPIVIASKRDGMPLSKDGPQNRPLHIQEAYRETRTAPGTGEFIRSSNVHLHQSGTNNVTHWLGELRR